MKKFDLEIFNIARYVDKYDQPSDLAMETAYWCLLDSIGCALLALNYPDCTKLLGPVVPGTMVPNGVHVPGTEYVLDPVRAAFNFGTMIRWLDYNDTWLAAEWGHPSDNLGGILMVADYLSRRRIAAGEAPLSIKDVLLAMIKAHEIQGVMALKNSFNQVGLDHVVLVKLATTAVVAQLLGADCEKICNAISLVWVDGQSLRTYRHAPNTGSRKSWAAGDATARGVQLAMMTMQGEMGYHTPLTAKQWGFYDVSFASKQFELEQQYQCYVMENVLFKISFPAEFHAQTAAECAIILHPTIKDRIDDIEKISLRTQESAMRIINKSGPLTNPADRDHCLQYITAIGLLYGELTSDHYRKPIADDERIDQLREKMQVTENPQFSENYLDPNKRSIGNTVQIFFKDGTATEEISIEYPIGHHQRRNEGIPLLKEKFTHNLRSRFSQQKTKQITQTCFDIDALLVMSVNEFVEIF